LKVSKMRLFLGTLALLVPIAAFASEADEEREIDLETTRYEAIGADADAQAAAEHKKVIAQKRAKLKANTDHAIQSAEAKKKAAEEEIAQSERELANLKAEQKAQKQRRLEAAQKSKELQDRLAKVRREVEQARRAQQREDKAKLADQKRIEDKAKLAQMQREQQNRAKRAKEKQQEKQRLAQKQKVQRGDDQDLESRDYKAEKRATEDKLVDLQKSSPRKPADSKPDLAPDEELQRALAPVAASESPPAQPPAPTVQRKVKRKFSEDPVLAPIQAAPAVPQASAESDTIPEREDTPVKPKAAAKPKKHKMTIRVVKQQDQDVQD
jgi:hypothetical protein